MTLEVECAGLCVYVDRENTLNYYVYVFKLLLMYIYLALRLRGLFLLCTHHENVDTISQQELPICKMTIPVTPTN